MHSFIGVLKILAAGLLLISANTLAGARVVNCDNGGSLQSAIESGAGSAARLEIQLLGTCHETFDFSRDRVSIIGDGNTTIVGSIRMFASDQVSFTDLTITGSGPGISLFDGRARLTRVNISGNDGVGVRGNQGAVIMFRDNSRINDNNGGVSLEHSYLLLINSEVNWNRGDGIVARMNSSVSLRNTTVHGNHGSGVFANVNSVVGAFNSHIDGNGGIGIFLRSGSSGEAHDCTINTNGQQGLHLTGKSTMDVYHGMVDGNHNQGVIVTEHSFGRFIDAQVRDNHGHGLIIGRDGGVVLEGNSRIEGNTDENFQVICQGKEASIDIMPPSFADPLECIDPDF